MTKFSLAVLLLLILASQALAEVKPVIKYAYFPVTPVPGQSLYKQIFLDTPIKNHENQPVAGNIHWPITYKFHAKTVSIDVCSIDQLEVTCECNINLPKLASSDLKLNSEFNAFQESVRVHELTHCRIATGYANRFEQKVKKLGKMKCNTIENTVKQIFDETFAEAHKVQLKFDEQESQRFRHYNPAKELLGNSYLENPQQNKFSPTAMSPPKADPKLGGIYKDKNGVWRNH